MHKEDLDQQLDALIEKAMKLKVIEESESFCCHQEELPFEPSSEHKKWMEEFLSRQQKAGRVRRRHRLSTRAAAVLLAAALGTTAFISSVEAARRPVERFIMEVKSRYTSLVAIDQEPERVGDDLVYDQIPEDLEDLYILDYVPWGYKFERLVVSEETYQTEYAKGESNKFDFRQIIGTRNIDVDTENAEAERVSIDGEYYLFSEKNSMLIVAWQTDKYSFDLSGTIDRETAIQIIKGIQKQ
ncbi:MAG: DUF4367 domain-containing protein [Peptococcaceae bacterium]|nr:DUF4367 domain-containing protein [Peptococcaceae bacterium]